MKTMLLLSRIQREHLFEHVAVVGAVVHVSAQLTTDDLISDIDMSGYLCREGAQNGSIYFGIFDTFMAM